jgi:hypothetical protein
VNGFLQSSLGRLERSVGAFVMEFEEGVLWKVQFVEWRLMVSC